MRVTLLKPREGVACGPVMLSLRKHGYMQIPASLATKPGQPTVPWWPVMLSPLLKKGLLK